MATTNIHLTGIFNQNIAEDEFHLSCKGLVNLTFMWLLLSWNIYITLLLQGLPFFLEIWQRFNDIHYPPTLEWRKSLMKIKDRTQSAFNFKSYIWQAHWYHENNNEKQGPKCEMNSPSGSGANGLAKFDQCCCTYIHAWFIFSTIRPKLKW